VRQAADRAEVSAGLVYCWIESGLLPHYRLGAKGRRGKIIIAEADLVTFLESMKVGVRHEPAPQATPRRLKLHHLELP